MRKGLWTRTGQGDTDIEINVSSQSSLLDSLGDHLDEQSGFCVATLNLDHVVKLRSDEAFRSAYRQHTHVTADGRPIVWVSRLAGDPVGLVTGSDLFDPMVQLCVAKNIPVAFFGSSDVVMTEASNRLIAKYPTLNIAAAISPPFGFDPQSPQAEDFANQIAASGARVCFLALGAPKQEVFAARSLMAHPNMGFLSIGAGLDFIAGSQVRAPKIFRALALEWLWRMGRDPRRMASRYGACAVALPGLMGRAISVRFASRGHGRTS